MGVLRGVRADGTEFKKRVTAKTTRLMIREPLASLDLGAIGDAPNLTVFEVTPPSGFVTLSNFEALGELAALEQIAIHVQGSPDLSALTRGGTLQHLSVHTGGDAPLDLAPLPAMPSLTSLAVYGNDQTSIDLAPLAEAKQLRSVNVSGGEWRALDLAPLSGLALEWATFDSGYLTELATYHVANPALEGLSLMKQDFSELVLSGFERCERLCSVSLGGNEMSWLDVSSLAGLASLTRFHWPNVKTIYLDEELEIRAPALSHLRQ